MTYTYMWIRIHATDLKAAAELVKIICGFVIKSLPFHLKVVMRSIVKRSILIIAAVSGSVVILGEVKYCHKGCSG